MWKWLTSSFSLGRTFNKLVVFNCICKKELVLQFPRRKTSLTLFNQQSHTHIQWLSQCLPSPKSPGFLNCCSLPGSSKEVISHNASLVLSPQFSLSNAPILGTQSVWEVPPGRYQSPLLLTGVGPNWGLAPGPYLMLWPFLLGWSIPPMSPVRAQPSRESEHRSEREPRILSGGGPPCLSRVALLRPG